jgi:hypothetical protein
MKYSIHDHLLLNNFKKPRECEKYLIYKGANSLVVLKAPSKAS